MNKTKVTGMVGLVAAGIGSICCVGPIILAGLGLGTSALTFARSFGILHMPMMILAIVLLGTAFFFHYNKNTSDCVAGCGETQPDDNKKTKYFLWTATIVTIFLFLFPYMV